jgi:hypothetical protein
MMQRRFVFALAVLGVCLGSAPAAAQVPQGTAEQLELGLTVTGVRIEPEAVSMSRGDTLLLTVILIDANGQRVEGTQFGLARASNHFDVRSVKDSVADSYLVWGVNPGESAFAIWVQVPDDLAGFQWNSLDEFAVMVEDWPVARVDMMDPAFETYAGTTFPLEAKAMTDHGTEHFAAEVTWRSETPSVATVTPGGVASFSQPGEVTFMASTEGITARRTLRVVENPVRQLDISPGYVSTRTGDVVHFDVKALDGRGRAVEGIALTYGVHGLDSAGAEIYTDGAFVAENPGTYKVMVTAGGLAQEAIVAVEPRAPATPVELLGRHGPSDVTTSDLWVFTGKDGRDYAYTGTHAEGGGNRMYVWDVTDPANIELMDSVVVDGRVVNDVKVNGDASWAILTREGASTRRNGVVVLDLATPAHPTIMGELTDSLTAGIHNVWINGDVVYAVNDGTSAMNILDLSDPTNPKHAGRWEIRPGEEDKSLHDVWADGRYAYLSYWDDGLVILDVGAGTHGGTPTDPAFVSSIKYAMGNTHTAFREGNYVFVGDEIMESNDLDGPLSPRGYIHVIDVSDIGNPQDVARFEVPEAGAHNVWVENGILYIAYYQAGLRIVDVSGELRGDLYRQGRQIGWFETAVRDDSGLHSNATLAWGPQPFRGNIFVSDMNSGLWVLHHERPAELSP